MDAYHAVNALYLNLFGHDADVGGLDYWAHGLLNGNFTVDQAAAVIAGGAQGSDLQIFGLRVAAASYFTHALDTADMVLRYEGSDGVIWGKVYLTLVKPDNPYPPIDLPVYTGTPIPSGFAGHGPVTLVGAPVAGPDLAGHGIHL
jgi:hypothetical protein